ncbi:MAG: Crp/Fnr family transcriptional regulator [Chloroflexi bacterium]|nr:Crp/Fnr family transcriptional regulator [Chloroflexota bacterium]
MDRRELLNVVPLFAGLSLRDWGEIEPLIYERHFARNEFVFRQGAPADTLYIVKTGQVKVIRHSSQGKDVVLRVCGEGQMLGNVGVFDGNGFLAAAQAIEPATTFCFSRSDCFEWVGRCPAFASAVIADLGRRLRGATDLICSLAVDRAEQRIARTLLRLASDSGQSTDDGVMIGMSLTRQDVADMTGTTVETAIRTMSKFRRQGLIRVQRRQVLLADVERLQDIAHTHWMVREMEMLQDSACMI